MSETKLLSRQEAAARLKISVDTLDAERQARRIAYIQRKPGTKVYITEEAIDEYLARATVQARPETRIRSTWQLGKQNKRRW